MLSQSQAYCGLIFLLLLKGLSERGALSAWKRIEFFDP